MEYIIIRIILSLHVHEDVECDLAPILESNLGWIWSPSPYLQNKKPRIWAPNGAIPVGICDGGEKLTSLTITNSKGLWKIRYS